jgi:drug/metabolite transporter (DMT)-like permease
MGFLGIVAINIKTDGFSFNIGDILIIAASFCTVFSNIISKKVFQTVKPITATGVSQLFGGIVLLVAGKMLGGDILFSLQTQCLKDYIQEDEQ